ncbi:MAG: hypothetical protein OXF97_04295, partial [Nitrospira sp.]|nr:hypothetical protein [Nitrospira sp.]
MSGGSAAEGDAVRFTVTRSGATENAVSVKVATAEDADEDAHAAETSDYTAITTAQTLSFASGDETKTVDVATTEDDIDEPDETFLAVLSVPALAADDPGTGVSIAEGGGSAKGTITDDDVRGITVSTATLTMAEADDSQTATTKEHEKTYTVVLTSEPEGGTVTVAVGVPEGAPFTADVAELEFDATDWDTAQTVTVTAVADAVDNAGDKREATITHTVSADDTDYDGETAESVKVTVTDDDDAPTGITLTADITSIGEAAANKTVTVTATVDGGTTYATATTVVVAVGGADDTATEGTDYATVNDFNIVIPKAGTSATGQFTLNPTDDAIDDDAETLGITGTSGSLSITGASITITDDDERGITVTPATLTLAEADTAGTQNTKENEGAYTVVLTSEPEGGTVTVTVTVPEGAPFTADMTELEFDAADWNTAQTVTVTAVADAVDNAGDKREATITHTVSADDTDYDGETAESVKVTVTDDDDAPTGITLTADITSIGEAAANKTVTVTATVDGGTTYATATTVVVAVGGADDTATEGTDYATVNDFNIVIPKAGTSATGQFTLNPTDDAIDDDAETLGITGTSGSLSITGASITITDDDERGITVSTATLTMAEADDSQTETTEEHKKTYTVVLTSAPEGGTVTVAVGVPEGAPFTADVTELEFDADDWNTAQTVTVTAVADAVDNTGDKREATITHTVSAADTDYDGETAGAVKVTVTDDDATPSFSVADASGDEGNAISFTVTRAGASGNVVTVKWATALVTGQATAADFTAVALTTLTFAAGVTEKTVSVTTTEDTLDEPNETFEVKLSAAGKAADDPGGTPTITRATATGTITDDDAMPSVKVTDASAVTEGNDPATTVNMSFPVTLSVVSGRAVTVTYTLGGTATSGSDYTEPNPLSVTIAAGERSADLVIPVKGDVVDEPNETIEVTLAGATNATLSTKEGETEATGTITDDDVAPTTATLTVSPDSVTEHGGGKTITVTATLGGTTAFAAAKNLTIKVGKAGDTATSGTDYAAVADVTLTIDAAARSGTKTFALTPTNDTLDEDDETLTVDGTAGGLTITGATITITDDDAMPSVKVTDASAVTEGNDPATTVNMSFPVTLSVVSGRAVTVTYTLGGTATSGSDYTEPNPLSVTIAAGERSADLVIPVKGDVVDEPNETVEVTLTGATNATLSGTAGETEATGTITDDDVRGITVTPATLTLAEADNSQTSDKEEHKGAYTVVLTSEPTGTVTVTVTVPASAPFTVNATTLEFDEDDWNTAQTVTVTAVADDIDNAGDKREATITHTVSAADTDYDGTTAGSVKVTVTDDDVTPTVSLDLAPATINESGTTTASTVTASLTGKSSAAVTVVVATAPGTGTTTGDYTVTANKTLTIAAGTTTSTGTVTITAVDNDVDGPNKSVTVSGTASGGGVGNPANQTLTITDDEDTPTVTLELTPSTIPESGEGNSSMVTARLTGKSHAAVTVTVATAPGANTATTDYTVTTNKILTIAAGTTTSTGTVTITAVDNDVDGPNKSVTVSGTASGGGVGHPASQTLTITDDEGVPTVALELTPSSINESGASNVSTVTATLTGKSHAAVTVTVATAPGANTATTDYTVTTNKILTIAAGTTTSTGTVTITAVDNDVDAPNKTVTVSGTASGGGVGHPANQTLTITDDDVRGITVAPGTLTVAEADNSQTSNKEEHKGAYTVVLTSAPEGGTVTVRVTVPASAPFTVDVTTLEFDATDWNTAQTVTVTAVADDIDNAGDKREATITHTVSAADTDYDGTTAGAVKVTVTDDDATPTVSLVLAPATINESGTTTVSTVTARLTGKSSAPMTVVVATAPGTGTTTGDYTVTTNKTLTIAAGATASTGTVTITAVDNDVDGPNKSVTVSGTASGGGVGHPASQTLTITDDDATPSFSVADASGDEGDAISFTVMRAGASGNVVTVKWATALVDDEATAADFTAVAATTLTFAKGVTTQTVSVTTTEDTLDEPNEDFEVKLSAAGKAANDPGGTPTISDATATGTITDDDATPSFSVGNASGNEGEAISFTVTRAGASGNVVTVKWATALVDDGATAADFTAVPLTTLTFAKGVTTKTVTVTTTEDTLDEPNETFEVKLSAAGKAADDPGGTPTISDATATGTITDDDVTPSFSVGNASGNEGEAISFTVTRAGASGNVVTVKWATALVDDGATAADFTAVPLTTLTFAKGVTTKTVTVTTTEDTLDEPNETFEVKLSAAGKAADDPGGTPTISDATATGTITDDDATPSFSVGNASGNEGEAISFTVTRAGASGNVVTVKWATALVDDGATAADFTAVPLTTLTFAKGVTTKTVTVTTTEDTLDEPNETFEVKLSAAGKAADDPGGTP